MTDLHNLARASCTREARPLPPIDAALAAELLEQVWERRAQLEEQMRLAPNARARSPSRKEHWWLGQFAELLEKWIALGR